MNSIYRSLYPLLFLSVSFLGLLFSPKIRRGFNLRRSRLKEPFLPQLKSSHWVHAASGEYEYARPLILELKERYPDIPVVVTYFSPTYAATIEKDPLVDYALPLPFDFPGAVSGFIKKINPKTLFIARTDLWPEVLMQCQQRKIPAVLFSYHQNKDTSVFAGLLKKWLLNKLTHIDCVNSESKKFLEGSVKPSVTGFGDTRYDRVIERLNHPKKIPFSITQKRVIVLGSTWKEDETQILSALEKTKSIWDLVIIAPHEPTPSHITDLKKKFDGLKLSYELFSEAKDSISKNILIVDQVGWLFDLYHFSALSFVGGSFKSTVHSVMEPLAHGSRTFLGPKIQNNAEALEFQSIMFQDISAIQVAENPGEIAEVIHQHFTLPSSIRENLSHFISNEVTQRSGASKKLLEHLRRSGIY